MEKTDKWSGMRCEFYKVPAKREERKYKPVKIVKMPPIRKPKIHRGPKPKTIAERQFTIKPIQYIERTYSQSQKLRVLMFLEHHEISLPFERGYRQPTQQEASEVYQIPRRTISDWVKKKKEIERVGKNSAIKKQEGELGYSRRVLWPELEDKLYSEFIERRKAGRIVKQEWFRIQSTFLFRSVYPDVNAAIFSFSNRWFRGFLSRHRISLRSITKTAQKLPEDYRILVINWLRFNRRNSQPRTACFWEVSLQHPVGRYELSNICNLDETPMPFEFLDGKTYNSIGEKTIWAKESKSGWGKRHASLVLCVFGDGIARIPPMIIFHGTGKRLGNEKEQYDPRVLVEYNPTAYMNESLFERYITNHLLPVLGGRPTLFAMDLMGSHKTSAILDLLSKSNITPSFIPAGCTSLVQPLDVSINKPLKERLRYLTNERIFQLESMEEFEKWTPRDRRIMITHCIGKAFYEFHAEKGEVIQRSFRKVGLTLPIDGSLDHELDVKGFMGLEIGDWRRDLGSLVYGGAIENEGYEEIEFVSTDLED